MSISKKKIWSSIGLSGLLLIILSGYLGYMNLRSADPILPGWEEYDQTRFEDLMQTGEPVLVEIYASWCPTCLLQHRAFETLHEEGRAPAIRAIRVDFDRDEAFIQANGFQSTGLLILYRDGKELARASGLVTPEKIVAFLKEYNI